MQEAEALEGLSKKAIRDEAMNWARFLYKQYKKKKLKEALLKQQESVISK